MSRIRRDGVFVMIRGLVPRHFKEMFWLVGDDLIFGWCDFFGTRKADLKKSGGFCNWRRRRQAGGRGSYRFWCNGESANDSPVCSCISHILSQSAIYFTVSKYQEIGFSFVFNFYAPDRHMPQCKENNDTVYFFYCSNYLFGLLNWPDEAPQKQGANYKCSTPRSWRKKR